MSPSFLLLAGFHLPVSRGCLEGLGDSPALAETILIQVS